MTQQVLALDSGAYDGAGAGGAGPDTDAGAGLVTGMDASFAGGAGKNLVTFQVDGGTYGVDITDVREIRAWSGATPLPHTADFIRGVMNLRGAVIPIVDLRARFGHGPTQVSENHVTVVVDIASRWVGLLVDAVSDIVDISQAEIQPSGDFCAQHAHGDVLSGVATMREAMIALIDTAHVLDGALVGPAVFD